MIPTKLNFRVWSYYDKKYLPPEFKESEIYVNAFGQVGYTKQTNDLPCLPQDELQIELFTGFYDKNKKQIYEGDIVSFEADSHDMGILTIVGEVAFKNGRFIIKGYEDLFPHYSFFDFISRYKDIRIIGNIHENPELLGDEK